MKKTIFLSVLIFIISGFQTINSQVNAGPDQEICADSTYMQAIDPFPYTGEWSVTGSSGNPVFENQTLYNTKVINLGSGINIFRWGVEIGGEQYFDYVMINNNSFTINAGPDQTVCTNEAVLYFEEHTEWELIEGCAIFSDTIDNLIYLTNLCHGENVFVMTVTNGNCSASDTLVITNSSVYTQTGQAIVTCADYAWIYATELNPGETGLWTLISGFGNIHDPTNNTTYVSELGFGENIFRWTVTNGVCTAFSDINVYCTLPDSMYLPNAGPDQIICEDHTVLEAGELLPGWEGYWTILAGSGYFTDPDNRITEVTSIGPDLNVFNWTIYWPEYGCSYSDYVEVTNASLYVNFTDSIFVCSNESYLNASAPGPGESGIWTVISGTGIIDEPTNFITAVSNLNTGENKFRWTLSNNHCSEYDNLIIFNNLHIASATALDTIVTADTAVLMGNFPLPDWSGHWEIITGGGTIADPNSPYTIVYDIHTGENTFRWSVTKDGCVNHDEVTISYDPVNVDLLPDFDIMIYPNPTDGFITVSSSVDLSDAIFELFSISGQQVNFKLIFISANAYETNLLNLTKGIYFLKIRLKDQIKLVKIVKK